MKRVSERINRLCDLLGIFDPHRADLALVVEDRSTYLAKHKARLATERGRVAIGDLANVALSLALEGCGLGLHLDWKLDGSELPDLMVPMIGELAKELPVDRMEADDNAYEVLESLHFFPKDNGYRLFQMPSDGDYYEVFVVADDDAERVDFLLASLGFGAGLFWDD